MYFLFDVGGTKTRCAVSKDGKNISTPKIIPTPKNAKTGIKILKKFADELSRGRKICAVAGGLAGSFDRTKIKIIGGGGNIKGWVGYPLQKELGRIFRAPVYLENDAALAGLAEARRGAGKNKEIVAYLTWSTGIGGARIVRGEIDANARGFEPSYQIVDAGGLCRACGGRHLGSHISGRAIEEHFGRKAEKLADPKIWNELIRWFAIALNNTIVYWSPDVIIVGGSVMKSVSLSELHKELKKIYHSSSLPPPPLWKAKLGDLGGLYGALELLKQKPRL